MNETGQQTLVRLLAMLARDGLDFPPATLSPHDDGLNLSLAYPNQPVTLQIGPRTLNNSWRKTASFDLSLKDSWPDGLPSTIEADLILLFELLNRSDSGTLTLPVTQKQTDPFAAPVLQPPDQHFAAFLVHQSLILDDPFPHFTACTTQLNTDDVARQWRHVLTHDDRSLHLQLHGPVPEAQWAFFGPLLHGHRISEVVLSGPVQPETPNRLRDGFGVSHSVIKHHHELVVGSPDQTLDALKQALNDLKRAQPGPVTIHPFRPPPRKTLDQPHLPMTPERIAHRQRLLDTATPHHNPPPMPDGHILGLGVGARSVLRERCALKSLADNRALRLENGHQTPGLQNLGEHLAAVASYSENTLHRLRQHWGHDYCVTVDYHAKLVALLPA